MNYVMVVVESKTRSTRPSTLSRHNSDGAGQIDGRWRELRGPSSNTSVCSAETVLEKRTQKDSRAGLFNLNFTYIRTNDDSIRFVAPALQASKDRTQRDKESHHVSPFPYCHLDRIHQAQLCLFQSSHRERTHSKIDDDCAVIVISRRRHLRISSSDHCYHTRRTSTTSN